MKINCIIGIDPGMSGGIAVWRPNFQLEVKKMPVITEQHPTKKAKSGKPVNVSRLDIVGLRDYFLYIKSITCPLVFIEKVNIRPSDLNIPSRAFIAAKMMENYEQLKGLLVSLDIPFCMVPPQKWQNDLNLKISGRIKEAKQERKNRYVKTAQSYYPEIKATLWSSDAVLIAHFGRWVCVNQKNWVYQNVPMVLHPKVF